MSDDDILGQDTLALQSYFAPNNNYLENLNAPQKEAVEYNTRPLLILAGAGTGKTKVLTTRIAHIVEQKILPPWSILAVTFTNKAAKEMRERVTNIIGESASNSLWLGTFHALAGRILRRHAGEVGLQESFTIINDDDQLRLIKAIYKEWQLDDKKLTPKTCLYFINKWKDKIYTPDTIPPQELAQSPDKRIDMIYKEYNARLLSLNAVDFADLLLHTITIFQKNASILQYWQNKFKMVLVDEYQDTNSAQYYWLRLLAQQHHNITCVGDDDQSIYGWRGAEIDNILKFEQDFKNAHVIRLEENYRSTPQILAGASALISHNQKRLGKTLWTGKEQGDNIKVCGHHNNDNEAEAIATDIVHKIHQHIPLKNIAILIRTGAQSRVLENKLNQQAIDYQVIGGSKFYEREEIRDIIAYLRLLYQEFDGLAFARIINKPTRGIGAKAQEKINQYARSHGVSLIQTLRDGIDNNMFSKKQIESITQFLIIYDTHQSLKTDLDVNKMQQFIEQMGVPSHYNTLPKLERDNKIHNINEFYSALADFSSLEAFLEHVALVTDVNQTTSHDFVSIMTIHAAKGLEFDYVYLVGVEEGLFPNQRALDEQGAVGLEEERRLAYVAFTRAKVALSVHFALNRRTYGQNWTYSPPSRFIDELPKNVTNVVLEPGMMPRGQSQNNAPTYQQERNKNAHSNNTVNFHIGDSITHHNFGEGVIIDLDDDVAHIRFETHGEKRILTQFVTKK